MSERYETGEFDYGGSVTSTMYENATDSGYISNQNVGDLKHQQAITGCTTYKIGPSYIANGLICNPEEGKIRSLFYGNGKKNWPPRDEHYVCCWDTYPFDHLPWGCCLEYKHGDFYMDERMFCSPECSLAWARAELYGKFNYTHILEATQLYFRKVMGLLWTERVHAAPPKEFLERFDPIRGISIDAYRQNFKMSEVTILPSNLLSTLTIIEEIRYKSETIHERSDRMNSAKKRSRTRKAHIHDLKKRWQAKKQQIERPGTQKNTDIMNFLFGKAK